jgi:hypothetical protein
MDKQYVGMYISTEYIRICNTTYHLLYIHFILMYCLVCVNIGVTNMSGYSAFFGDIAIVVSFLQLC